ncbi:hypothetical protein D9M72_466330 [compost metagenome]
MRRDRVEQRQRRQVRVLDIGKQRLLLLAFHALMLGHGLRTDDLHRRRLFDAHALHLDGFLALDLGGLADDAVLLALAACLEAQEHGFDETADMLGHRQPREVEEQRQPDREQQQQQQRRPGEAQRHLHPAAQRVAQHPARRARQRGAQRVHADRLQAHAGQQRQHEADPAHRHALAMVLALGQLGRQRAPAAPAAPHQQHRPPVGREAEDEEQHVCHPGADTAAQVVDIGDLVRMRPAGVGLAVAGQHAQEAQRDGQQQEPAHLAQQFADAGRQG